MRTTILAVIAVLALAGCGGKTPVAQTGPAPSASTVATPSPAPSTPTVLTRQQAGQRYLAITKPTNDVFDRPDCATAEDYLVNGGSWDRSKYGGKHADQVLRVCYKELIPLFTAQIQAIQSTPWPADAKQDIADLVSLDQGFLHWLTQAAKGTTADQMYTALQSVPPDDGSADRVRARLGLPGRAS